MPTCQATSRTTDDLENKQDVMNVEERLHMNSSKIGIASAKSGRRQPNLQALASRVRTPPI